MSFNEIGYVLAVYPSKQVASVYCKHSPNVEIFFEWSEEWSNVLKPGNIVSFLLPDSLEQSDVFVPAQQNLRKSNKRIEKLRPENPTKYSQIQFVTDAIFTVQSSDDRVLLNESDVYAIGFSSDFGRFVVTQDFDNSDNIEFEPGRVYQVAISRYAPKSGLKNFARWKTMLVCDKVLYIDDDYNAINSLQEQCPWRQNLKPIVPPKRIVSQEVQINKTKIAKIEAAKIKENIQEVVVTFGLVVEKNEKFTLIFASVHKTFYRISNNVDLIAGCVYTLKLADEIEGVFQNVSANKVYKTGDIRSITRGLIEAVFDVELCEIADPIFPAPWILYGETKCLGKVMIPKSDNLPPIGSTLTVRAIFLNKPVEDFCWTFTELLPSSEIKEPIEQVKEVVVKPARRPITEIIENIEIVEKPVRSGFFDKVETPIDKPTRRSITEIIEKFNNVIEKPAEEPMKETKLPTFDGISARSTNQARRSPLSDSESDDEEDEFVNKLVSNPNNTSPTNEQSSTSKSSSGSVDSSIVFVEKPISQSQILPTQATLDDESDNQVDYKNDNYEYASTSNSEFDEDEIRVGTGEEEPEFNVFTKLSKSEYVNLSANPEKTSNALSTVNEESETSTSANLNNEVVEQAQENYAVSYFNEKQRSMFLATDSEGEDELDISVCSGLHSSIDSDEEDSDQPTEQTSNIPKDQPNEQTSNIPKNQPTVEEAPFDAKTSISNNSARNTNFIIKKDAPKPIITQDSDEETTDDEFYGV